MFRIPTATSFGPRTKLYSTIAIFVFALLAAAYQVSQFMLALGLIVISFVGSLPSAFEQLARWSVHLFGWLSFEDGLPWQQRGHLFCQGYPWCTDRFTWRTWRAASQKKCRQRFAFFEQFFRSNTVLCRESMCAIFNRGRLRTMLVAKFPA